MAISTVVKTRRDGTLTISDAAGAHTLTVAYEAGDFSLSVPGPTVNNFLDRGEIGSAPSLRYGDDAPMTFSFTAQLRDISDATYITLESIILNSGQFASTWVSTNANTEGGATATATRLKTVTLLWTIEGTERGDTADHSISLPFSILNGSLSEGDPNSISISGTSYAVWPVCV